MPNGKIGDHPITDITLHKRRVFTDEIDALIRDIVAAAGRPQLDSLVDWFGPPPLAQLRRRLQALDGQIIRSDGGIVPKAHGETDQ